MSKEAKIKTWILDIENARGRLSDLLENAPDGLGAGYRIQVKWAIRALNVVSDLAECAYPPEGGMSTCQSTEEHEHPKGS